MNTKIMSSLSSSLQDRRTILESKTRESVLKGASRIVESKTGSPPGSKGDGLFESELSRQAQRDERSTRPRELDKTPTAKTDKTENLRSHSGAGTDSRKSKIERRQTQDRQAADRAVVRPASDSYSKDSREGISSADLRAHDERAREVVSSRSENASRVHDRESTDESTQEKGASPNDFVRGENLEATRSADREVITARDPEDDAADESNVREISPLRSRQLAGSGTELSKSSQLMEAEHGDQESEDDSVDMDATNTLIATNQSLLPKSIKDPKLLKQMELSGSAVVANSVGQRANAEAADGEAAKTDFTPKQKAMLELLQGMQKELGVSPETMLKAFGGMSTTSLEAPPEQTSKEFVTKLTQEAQLTPQESGKATALYGKFLGEHSQAEFDETLDGLKVARAIQDGSMGSAVLEKLDRSVGELEASLKGLQKGTQTPEELQAEVARLMQLSQSLKAGKNEGETSIESAKELSLADSDAEETVLNDLSVDSLKDFTVQNDKNLQTTLSGRGGDLNLGGQFDQGGSFAGSQSGQQRFREASTKASSTSPSMGSTGAKASLRGEMVQAMKAMNGDETNLSTNMSTPSASAIPLSGKQSLASLAGEGSTLAPKNGSMALKDEEANVKELMRQAQLIVKKGGGEMKLEMSPEGMGKVHLKVGVENGQVNVQMLAESDAAKKMLENNIGDLRASLVAHKLHVDQLKVDTKVEANADVSKQMDQQMRGDANRDHARQSARDFMSEFRDDREGFRQGFFGDPKGRGYARQARSEVKPDTVSAMAARKTGALSRLNVVA